VDVLDAAGRPLRVDARLGLSAPPAAVHVQVAAGRGVAVGLRGGEGDVDGAAARLVAWAGPWPMVERWWTETPRRRVHLQVELADGRALLLACTADAWTCEAIYD